MSKEGRDIPLILSLVTLFLITIFLIYQRFDGYSVADNMAYLGKQFFAMVPESPEKNQLTEWYEHFLDRIEDREVKPRQVRDMASLMINYTHLERELDIKEAERVLEPLRQISRSKPEEPSPQSINRKKQAEQLDRQWDALNTRLKAIRSFSKEISVISNSKSRSIKSSVTCIVDSNLNILLNKKLQNEIEKKELKRIVEEIKKLEKENLLRWQDEARVNAYLNSLQNLERAVIKAKHKDAKKRASVSVSIPPMPEVEIEEERFLSDSMRMELRSIQDSIQIIFKNR